MTYFRFTFIFPQEIAEDCCAFRVGGHYPSAAVYKTVGLVNIQSLTDVGWNEPIVLKRLGDAVDLYGERDRETRLL